MAAEAMLEVADPVKPDGKEVEGTEAVRSAGRPVWLVLACHAAGSAAMARLAETAEVLPDDLAVPGEPESFAMDIFTADLVKGRGLPNDGRPLAEGGGSGECLPGRLRAWRRTAEDPKSTLPDAPRPTVEEDLTLEEYAWRDHWLATGAPFRLLRHNGLGHGSWGNLDGYALRIVGVEHTGDAFQTEVAEA